MQSSVRELGDGSAMRLERLMAPEDVKRLTGLSYHAILRAIRAGRLPAMKLEGRWKITVDAYRQWLAQAVYEPSVVQRTPSLDLHRSTRRMVTSPTGSLAALTAIEDEVG